MGRLLDYFAPLREYHEYRLRRVGRSAADPGREKTIVAIPIQVYDRRVGAVRLASSTRGSEDDMFDAVTEAWWRPSIAGRDADR